jgi:hypothetical protein
MKLLATHCATSSKTAKLSGDKAAHLVGLAHPLNPGAGVSWQALSPFSLWRCATVRYPALRKYLHPTTRAATPTLPDSDRRRTPE